VKILKQIYRISLRECGILMKTPIYGFCMVVFPLLVFFFFTSLMNEGVPEDIPIGVVDMDNSSTSRSLIRKLDAFQTSKVVAHYNNFNDARQAIQQGKIYAFLYIPKGTAEGMISSKQPKVSFYYNAVTMVAGSMTFRDLKTITTLGSAAVGQAKMSAIGKTEKEIRTFLQPIVVDLHMINNPWSNYNVYLSTTIAPGVLMILIFLITAYSIGTELKFNRSKEWLAMADNNIYVAMLGKMLPQTLIFLTIFYLFEFYIFHTLGFPHQGGTISILLLGLFAVLACQGFGIFAFGLMPSLRMSMSICSLWAVLGISASGATYPIFAMNPMITALAQLFPLRHYYMFYQICVFNGYPFADAYPNIMALCFFAIMPIFTLWNTRKAMLEYIYIP